MIIFSDPHLGLNRRAHTTKGSRVRLADSIHAKALEVASSGEVVVCAGDLFDTFSNSEETIINAAKVAAHCDVILAGNHDSLNQRDVKGSLDVVGSLLEGVKTEVVSNPDFSDICVRAGDFEGMTLAFIPHHATQELFEAAIDGFIKETDAPVRGLFLHCNYDNPMTEGSEATLNLTAEKAKRLLAKTDYVFLGHEHQPRQALDGRVVILGNTHPTSFGDISDKYYWTLTPDSLEKTLCWEAEAHFVEADINSTDALFPAGKDIQFVDVVGAVTADNGAEVARFIHDIWETVKPLMVRNSVSIVASNHATAEVVDVADLPAQIGKQLKGTNLEATYNYYWGKI